MLSSLGKLKGVKVKLHVDPEAKGAVQKQRRIYVPFKDKFDNILDNWEEIDIIEDVGDEPIEWCSNEALNFFRLLDSNCVNWKIYCDDHSSHSSTTAVQI